MKPAIPAMPDFVAYSHMVFVNVSALLPYRLGKCIDFADLEPIDLTAHYVRRVIGSFTADLTEFS